MKKNLLIIGLLLVILITFSFVIKKGSAISGFNNIGLSYLGVPEFDTTSSDDADIQIEDGTSADGQTTDTEVPDYSIKEDQTVDADLNEEEESGIDTPNIPSANGPYTYISFSEGGGLNQWLARYASVDSNSNVRINTIDTINGQFLLVNPPLMIKDSRKVNFLYSTLGILSGMIVNDRIYYKNENTINLPPEIVPISYATGPLLNLTGYHCGAFDAVVDNNNNLYVGAACKHHTGSNINVSNDILISKRSSSGIWTPATVLVTLPALISSGPMAFEFDGVNGHVFYYSLTIPTCTSGCTTSLYESVFSLASLNVISTSIVATGSTTIMPNSDHISFRFLNPIRMLDGSYVVGFRNSGTIKLSRFGVNGWVTEDVLFPQQPSFNSLDLRLIGKRDLQFTVAGHPTNRVSLLTSDVSSVPTSVGNWNYTSLLPLNTVVAATVKNQGSNQEEGLYAYLKSSLGGPSAADEIHLLTRVPAGSQSNILIHQTPSNFFGPITLGHIIVR
ncbi:MAG: hypothetical protein AAB534_03435 [Patescibacteria group bacterium]